MDSISSSSKQPNLQETQRSAVSAPEGRSPNKPSTSRAKGALVTDKGAFTVSQNSSSSSSSAFQHSGDNTYIKRNNSTAVEPTTSMVEALAIREGIVLNPPSAASAQGITASTHPVPKQRLVETQNASKITGELEHYDSQKENCEEQILQELHQAGKFINTDLENEISYL